MRLGQRDLAPGGAQRSGDARSESEDLLESSPSLRCEIGGIVAKQAARAAKLAAEDLQEHGEPTTAIPARLQQGGFTAEQILGDWFPDPPS